MKYRVVKIGDHYQIWDEQAQAWGPINGGKAHEFIAKESAETAAKWLNRQADKPKN